MLLKLIYTDSHTLMIRIVPLKSALAMNMEINRLVYIPLVFNMPYVLNERDDHF